MIKILSFATKIEVVYFQISFNDIENVLTYERKWGLTLYGMATFCAC